MLRLVLFCVLLSACVVPVYDQHRGALVPHATPVQSTGQPMDRTIGLALGATNLADLARADAGVDPAPGIAVAQHQARATLTIAPKDYIRVGWFHERALRSRAQEISPSLPPLDDDAASGYGMSLGFSIPTSTPGFRVGVDAEFTAWFAPYISYTTSNVAPQTIDHGYDFVGTAAVGVTPSYRSGPWTTFVGATLRNHPMMQEKVESTYFPPEPDVEEGPVNVVVAGGASFTHEDVEVVFDVHQDMTTDPVRYGPALGLTLKLSTGRAVAR